jgi:hypothetical protein
VGVEREDEPRRIDAAPGAGVDPVVARHPAQEQERPLAGAPVGGARHEGRGAAPPEARVGLPQPGGERGERPLDRRPARVPLEERRLEGAALLPDAADGAEERRDVVAVHPAVAEAAERRAEPPVRGSREPRGGPGPEGREGRLDRREDRLHAAEGEPRRDDPRDLEVVPAPVAAHDLQRVGVEAREVEGGAELVEPEAEERIRHRGRRHSIIWSFWTENCANSCALFAGSARGWAAQPTTKPR